MAVLDRIDASRVRSRVRSRETGPLSLLLDIDLAAPGVDALVAEVRREVAEEVWRWFREHEDRPVLTIRIAYLIRYTVRLREVRRVVEWLVGPEPEPEPEP